MENTKQTMEAKILEQLKLMQENYLTLINKENGSQSVSKSQNIYDQIVSEMDNYIGDSLPPLASDNTLPNQIISQLRAMLYDFFAKNRKVSPNAFGQRNGVGVCTMHYLITGRTKKKILPSTVLKLVCGLNKAIPVYEVIANCKGPVGDFLRIHFPLISDVKIKTRPAFDLGDYINCKNSALISALASCHSGTTRKEIRQYLKFNGEEVLDEMIDRHLLREEENGKIRTINGDLYIADRVTMKMAVNLMKGMSSKHEDSGVRVIWGSLDKDGIEKVKLLLDEYGAKMINILKRHETQDGTPFFGSLSCSPILPIDNEAMQSNLTGESA